MVRLRIKDIVFKLTPDKKQYAEILVNGKTGTRHIPLIDSLPYIKDWISQHPQVVIQIAYCCVDFVRVLTE
jgi:integrase/recombinase XerD